MKSAGGSGAMLVACRLAVYSRLKRAMRASMRTRNVPPRCPMSITPLPTVAPTAAALHDHEAARLEMLD
jgi:hypothetical protein